MQISVIGLGYVGLVTAVCLAHDGYQVIGADIDESKVVLVKRGRSPIIEDKIDSLVSEGVQSGRLSAVLDTRVAIDNSDLALICVGTPGSAADGSLDSRNVESVSAEIGRILRHRERPFTFVLRSTVIPGTVREIVIPTLERYSGKPHGDGYNVLYHPEFLREGSSIEDYYEPSRIVVGVETPGTADQLLDLYSKIQSEHFITSIDIAEVIKYADNAFHALKITFANEIGQFCQEYGIDSREMMRLFYADTKLNISAKYLQPAFAFGGSCLPKDLRALVNAAHAKNLSLPMLEAVLPSNDSQIIRALKLILSLDGPRVGMVGIAFKPGTDDLRESPLIRLAERLVREGNELLIYDPRVKVSQLLGVNKTYTESRLPNIEQLMVKSLEDFECCDTIVVGHPVDVEYIYRWLDGSKKVVDMIGSVKSINHQNYHGVLW